MLNFFTLTLIMTALVSARLQLALRCQFMSDPLARTATIFHRLAY